MFDSRQILSCNLVYLCYITWQTEHSSDVPRHQANQRMHSSSKQHLRSNIQRCTCTATCSGAFDDAIASCRSVAGNNLWKASQSLSEMQNSKANLTVNLRLLLQGDFQIHLPVLLCFLQALDLCRQTLLFLAALTIIRQGTKLTLKVCHLLQATAQKAHQLGAGTPQAGLSVVLVCLLKPICNTKHMPEEPCMLLRETQDRNALT